MKVVHVSHTDIRGGAARAGYGIFKSLDTVDVEAKMLVQRKFGLDKNVFGISDSWLSNALTNRRIYYDLLPMYLFTNTKLGRFSFGKVGIDISSYNLIEDADLLHFHWINEGFLSLKSIEQLSVLNKPIFWTLHDMWPFTGGCHYTNDCKRYITQCNCCPYLKNSSPNDNSFKIWKSKKRIFDKLKLNIVSPSHWLKNCAKNSALFNDLNINVIPYSIDLSLFKQLDKTESRNRLNLPLDKLLILFGSMNIKDERKGFKYFKESIIKLISNHPEYKDMSEIVVFGRADESMQSGIPIKFNFCGRIESDAKMVAFYNAADFFVSSSLEDNYPNTVMESLACGLPVIAFNIGGMPDMINHLTNGYLIETKNSELLMTGIKWMIDNKEKWNDLSTNARKNIIKNNSPDIIGKSYLALYNDALSNSKINK